MVHPLERIHQVLNGLGTCFQDKAGHRTEPTDGNANLYALKGLKRLSLSISLALFFFFLNFHVSGEPTSSCYLGM